MGSAFQASGSGFRMSVCMYLLYTSVTNVIDECSFFWLSAWSDAGMFVGVLMNGLPELSTAYFTGIASDRN